MYIYVIIIVNLISIAHQGSGHHQFEVKRHAFNVGNWKRMKRKTETEKLKIGNGRH